MITDKVRIHHLERKALLYVRQSSAHQVLHSRESSVLQYAMRDRLIALGWSKIEVIDDDPSAISKRPSSIAPYARWRTRPIATYPAAVVHRYEAV